MKLTLKRKSIWSIIFMVLLAFLVGLCLCFSLATRFYVSVKENSMIDVYERIETLYESSDDITSDENSGAFKEISSLCEENTISVLIMGSSGTIEYIYGNPTILAGRLRSSIFGDDYSTARVTENENYLLQIATSSENSTYIELIGTVGDDSWFIARSSYAGITKSVKVSLLFFCIVCAIVFVIVSIAIYLLIKPYNDSINSLMKFAQDANEGNFNIEYFDQLKRSNDELGVLSDSISEMAKNLEKTISELKTSNLRLEKELNNKIAEEEARKKYMSDVSHELKTPIALISGYAEGLKEGISDDPEDREYYCNVIIDEADKMNLMIKKLATLNLLENGKNEVTLERFDVVEVIDGFLNTMALVIQEKDINIFFDNTNNVCVWSDEFLFEEVLMNYFNNAVNHLKGERNIRINVEHREDSKVRISVFNTGNNIDEDEIDKIWGKFYKVDKARTREYGGSGLGLSIVKAIADATNQKCGAYNMPDGVVFWIEVEDACGKSGNSSEECKPESKKLRDKISELPIWQKTAKALKKDDSDDHGDDK